MTRAIRLVALSMLPLLGSLSSAHADFESQLLSKFQRQNENHAEETLRTIRHRLDQAESLRTAEPETAAGLLAEVLHLFRADTTLPKSDRDEIGNRLDRLARALEADRASVENRRIEETVATQKDIALPEVPGRLKVGQAAGGFVPVPTGGAFQVTPVVSADRRYVRIGVNGFFSIARPGPLVASPVFVPTVLQGPGRNFTVLPFATVAQPRVLVGPAVGQTLIGLNTTATVPVGGSRVLGGYSSSSFSRYEFGTPVLGRIPYLAPLFRGVGFGAHSNHISVVIGR